MSVSSRMTTAAILVVLCATAASAAGLRNAAGARGFYVGAAVDATALASEKKYKKTLTREFNVVVGENAFKFASIHPQPTTYDFRAADSIAKVAGKHGMRLRGHTLVWHQQIPDWLRNGTFTRDEAIQVLHDHIMTVVSHYRGKVWAWDVVNEAIADDGSGLRTSSFWFQKIGSDYIDMAFQFAHEADPDAQLYYNDYGAEGGGAKSDAVYNLVKGLQSRGIPIDGVGWQMHVESGFRTSQAHRDNAERLAALGLHLMVTELDVRITLPVTADALEEQADTYRDIFGFCLSEPMFDAVLTWGFTDKHSWVPGFFKGQGAALPFDAKYKRKPAYTAIAESLQAARRSPTSQ